MPIIDGRIDQSEGPIITLCIGPCKGHADALKAQGLNPPPPVQVQSLIDTGAGGTVIDSSVVATLGLISNRPVIDVFTLLTEGAPQKRKLYDISLWLPPPSIDTWLQVFVPQILAVEAVFPATRSVKAILGRDVLSRCTLFYNGRTNTFSIAY